MSKSAANRTFERAKGVAPVQCHDTRGRLLDISRGGMAFSVGENFDRFQLGESAEFLVKLPRNEENPTGLEFSATGTIRRIDMNEAKSRLTLGLQFEDLSEESRLMLNRVILFFAQNFAPLQALDQIFTIPKKEDEKPISFNKDDLQKIFTLLVEKFETFPANTQDQLRRFAQGMAKELNLD